LALTRVKCRTLTAFRFGKRISISSDQIFKSPAKKYADVEVVNSTFKYLPQWGNTVAKMVRSQGSRAMAIPISKSQFW
jgi:hypothetical protein